MKKEDVCMLGFEIVAYAGDARSALLDALSKAKEGHFEEAQELIAEAQENIKNAHKTQTDMLAKEASGDDIEMSFIMIHGQDHLMTTLLLKDLVEHIIYLYKKG
ncbi:PTS lactose transporter subunit IIA [Granulicatella sp. zg-ZJ]|uniref:PTS lactose/cellobiose transporter subunit IIA n=1 Tax=unclassified Granulicatella TaxID=2630493 RepID=UPI0013C1DC32|nr:MULTISPECIES: PTS lactose/cellobiose transporter subunit IIA [unclassified Granulicatella]MBS4750356.1 lactose-specific PTS transporter subunit IIA [Carnobacteriaceae bacterium zg-ZUI78]NEW63234.1 PTS lactose transporter subunit IIA [Granulicatella sp. zg-ZJ]NEW65970.1 PTS lactose transporter subunit IIA [Granulicatella sp. zg-84]QMI85884.1 PTS lactose/cellobiose transporter subunit IIA [Carnobacteriaceae bacterium zg-84]